MSEVNTSADSPVLASIEPAVKKIGDMILKSMDFKDLRDRQYAIGKAMVEELIRRRNAVNKDAPRGVEKFKKEDFDGLALQVKNYLRTVSSLTDPRADDYVRYFLFMEHAAQVVGLDRARTIAYRVAVNVIFPKMMLLDKIEVSADVKAKWQGTFGTVVEALCGDAPFTHRDLEAAIAAREIAIANEAKAKLTAEQVAEQEARAKRAEKAAAEAKARKSITDGIDTALSDDLMDADEVMGLVEKLFTQRKAKPKTAGINPALMGVDEARQLAAAMFAANNVDAMRELHATLGRMLRSIPDATLVAEAA